MFTLCYRNVTLQTHKSLPIILLKVSLISQTSKSIPWSKFVQISRIGLGLSLNLTKIISYDFNINERKSSEMFEVKTHERRGRGLYATQAIEPGVNILVQKAIGTNSHFFCPFIRHIIWLEHTGGASYKAGNLAAYKFW